jgi:large subunit ribosomal protein L22
MAKEQNPKIGHVAKARTVSAPISTKHTVEICHHIRYKSTTQAKFELEEAIALRTAIPFRKFNKDLGHKAGMGPGRYPIKAASIILQLVKSAEANAQDVGLDISSLKISKAIANKAAVQATGGRRRATGKRTHVELEVIEFKAKQTQKAKKEQTKKKVATKKVVSKEEKQTPKVVAKKESVVKTPEVAKKVVEPVTEQPKEESIKSSESTTPVKELSKEKSTEQKND